MNNSAASRPAEGAGVQEAAANGAVRSGGFEPTTTVGGEPGAPGGNHPSGNDCGKPTGGWRRNTSQREGEVSRNGEDRLGSVARRNDCVGGSGDCSQKPAVTATAVKAVAATSAAETVVVVRKRY